jgi:hypothetical protein
MMTPQIQFASRAARALQLAARTHVVEEAQRIALAQVGTKKGSIRGVWGSVGRLGRGSRAPRVEVRYKEGGMSHIVSRRPLVTRTIPVVMPYVTLHVIYSLQKAKLAKCL